MESLKVEMLSVVSRMKGSKYLCKCDCGNERVVSVGHFNTGKFKSCGCHKVSHGHASGNKKSPEYTSYHNMLSRCFKDSNKRYKDYGAIGISVCERWVKSFENFICDMGPCPAGFQIDRIDNNLGYSKENCRWTSRKENQANRSNSRVYNIFGVDYQSAMDAGKANKVSYQTILSWCGLRKRKSGGFYAKKDGCECSLKYKH